MDPSIQGKIHRDNVGYEFGQLQLPAKGLAITCKDIDNIKERTAIMGANAGVRLTPKSVLQFAV